MPKIRIAGQEPTANPTKLLEAFQGFYSKLYSPLTQTSRDSICRFLDDLPIPSLDTKHRNLWEAALTGEEVMEVNKGLKKG